MDASTISTLPPPPSKACVYDPVRAVVDMRHTAPRRIPRSLVVRGATVMREPSTITGVVIHQMGVELGVGPRRLLEAGGDADLAQMLRARDIPAHASVYREGWVVAPHPLAAYLHHANGLNATTLGLEVEGLYDGLSTGDRQPDQLTIDTARRALRWLVDTARAEGMPLEWLWAHRQSKRTRRADPGAGLWAALATYANEELGLVTRPDMVVGDGRPIPTEWDPRSVGRY